MKKQLTIIVIACFCFAIASHAQNEKGKVMVGLSSDLNIEGMSGNIMSIGFSSTKDKSDASDFEESDADKTFGIVMIPKVGFFVIDNLAVGLDINLAFSNTKFGGSSNTYSAVSYCLGPYVRYYITTPRIFPFFEVGASFGGMHDKYETDDEKYESDYGLMKLGGGAGIAIPIGDRVSFDIMAGYVSTTIKEKDNDDNERQITGTFGFKLGFVVFLGK